MYKGHQLYGMGRYTIQGVLQSGLLFCFGFKTYRDTKLKGKKHVWCHHDVGCYFERVFSLKQCFCSSSYIVDCQQ